MRVRPGRIRPKPPSTSHVPTKYRNACGSGIGIGSDSAGSNSFGAPLARMKNKPRKIWPNHSKPLRLNTLRMLVIAPCDELEQSCASRTGGYFSKTARMPAKAELAAALRRSSWRSRILPGLRSSTAASGTMARENFFSEEKQTPRSRILPGFTEAPSETYGHCRKRNNGQRKFFSVEKQTCLGPG